MPFPADPLGLLSEDDEEFGPFDPFAPEEYPEEQFNLEQFQDIGRPRQLPPGVHPGDDPDRGIMDLPVDELMQQRRGLAPTPDMRVPEMFGPRAPLEDPEDFEGDYPSPPEEEASLKPRQMSTEDELDMVHKAMSTKGPYDRPDRPGRPAGEGGGGNVVPLPKRGSPYSDRDQLEGFRIFDRFTGEWVGPKYAPSQQMQGQRALDELKKKSDTILRYGLEPFYSGE